MGSNPAPATLSELDEKRFGIKTAKALGVTAATLPGVLQFCIDHDVVLLIARCSADNLCAAQAMERAGFLLMDTLVYWSRDLVHTPLPDDKGRAPIRPVRPGEAEQVRQVAAAAFRGYFGHYHADERLDDEKCDEVYADWAYRCATSRESTDEVLVAEIGGNIAGFMTVWMNSAEEGELGVAGTAREARGQGVYSSLILGCLEWCKAHGVHTAIASTQIYHTAVQRVWAKAGFLPSHALYTFHKWFD